MIKVASLISIFATVYIIHLSFSNGNTNPKHAEAINLVQWTVVFVCLVMIMLFGFDDAGDRAASESMRTQHNARGLAGIAAATKALLGVKPSSDR